MGALRGRGTLSLPENPPAPLFLPIPRPGNCFSLFPRLRLQVQLRF